jgi:hypothetical protein
VAMPLVESMCAVYSVLKNLQHFFKMSVIHLCMRMVLFSGEKAQVRSTFYAISYYIVCQLT